MAERVVGPGIANNYVCGKLIRKFYGEFTSPTGETKIIELASRSFEAVCDRCPFPFCIYILFDILNIVVKINNEEVELKSERLEISSAEKISSGKTEGPL